MDLFVTVWQSDHIAQCQPDHGGFIMARRTSTPTTSTTPDSTEPVTPTESVQEDTVSTTTEASPEATKPAEVAFDLTAFKAAVAAAVEGADQSTGEIAAGVLEPVVKEYRAVEGIKGKNKAKEHLADQMREAMGKPDIVAARSYLQLQDSMTAGSGGSTPKAPTDPTEAYVQADATLRLAVALHTPGEGVSEDHESKVATLVSESTEKANEYLAWVNGDADSRGDEPEVNAVVKNAVKLALGKAAKAGGRSNSGGGSGDGVRRDIGKHISEAFEGVESGTFLTVAEIRKHESSEYGKNSPSAGAISARLFPASGKCTIEGITPGQGDKGNKGATKD